MIDNCGLPAQSRYILLDRKNNDGNYEPGNLRWTNARASVRNRRCSKLPEAWEFVETEWPYPRGTVVRYLTANMTRGEILERARETVRRKRRGWRLVAERFARMTF